MERFETDFLLIICPFNTFLVVLQTFIIQRNYFYFYVFSMYDYLTVRFILIK